MTITFIASYVLQTTVFKTKARIIWQKIESDKSADFGGYILLQIVATIKNFRKKKGC